MEDNYKEKYLSENQQKQLNDCFDIIREYKKSKGKNLKQGEKELEKVIFIPQYWEGELTEEIKKELHGCFELIRAYKEKNKKNSNNGRRGEHERFLSMGKHLTIEDMLKSSEILKALEREKRRKEHQRSRGR